MTTHSIPVIDPTFYIPPPGMWFRLACHEYGRVLHCSPDRVGSYPEDQDYNDHYFTLVAGTGARDGMYKIKSKEGGLFLCSGDYGTGKNYNDRDDNYYVIIPGSGEYKDYFRLYVPATDHEIFAANGPDRDIGAWPPSPTDAWGDHFFTFHYKDMEIVSVKYDLDHGVLSTAMPMLIAEEYLENRTSIQQTGSFEGSEGTTHTTSYSKEKGFSITVGMEFTAGVPEVASASAKLEVTGEQKQTWGKEDGITKTYTINCPVTAPPHSIIHATAIVQKADLKVPYTVTLRQKSSDMTTESKGTWSGVTTYSLHYTTEQVDSVPDGKKTKPIGGY